MRSYPAGVYTEEFHLDCKDIKNDNPVKGFIEIVRGE